MIEVELPDGRVVEFPPGTSQEVIRSALRKLTQQEPNTNPGVSAAAPPDMIYNPNTGQYTSRELLANAAEPTRADAMQIGAMQGLSFGGADEAIGALNAATGGGAEAYTFGREYTRAQEDAARRDFPITTGASEVAGGVGTALTYGLPAIANRGLTGATLAGGGVGALEGSIFGFLSGEGGASERATNARDFGLLSGLFGAAAPAVISGARSLGRGLLDIGQGGVEAVTARGSESRAMRALGDTMRRADATPDDVQSLLDAAARDGQPEFTVADALGNAGQRRLSGLTRSGGDASADIADFLNARQLDQSDRVGGFVADAFSGTPNPDRLPMVPGSVADVAGRRQTAAQAEIALEAMRDRAADEAFGRVRDVAAPVDVRGVLGVLDSKIKPFEEAGIDDAALNQLRALRSQLAGQSKDGATELSNFNKVFQIRRRLRDTIDRLYRTGESEVARDLKAVRQAMDLALEGASDEYQAAMTEFRRGSQVIEAVDQGRNMARPGTRASDNTQAFSTMTPEQQAAARVGYGDRALARVEAAAGEGTNKARPFTSSKAQQEASTMATDPDLFARRIDRENTMFETRNRALGGSRTADNQEDIADLAGYDLSVLGNVAALRFGTAAQQVLAQSGDVLTGMNPQTRQILARAMLARDASALRQALAQAETSEARKQVLDIVARLTAQRAAVPQLVEQ